MKTCTKCNQEKSFTEFYTSKTHKGGYHCYCKPCESERSKTKNAINRERRLAKAKEWRKSNPDKANGAIKAWQERNKERYAKLIADWATNNRDKVNAKWMQREAGKKKRTPQWLTDEMKKQIEVEYSLANWCSNVMNESYHVDHIVPLQGKTVSGLHVPWNLQVIPAKVNQRKSNKVGA